MTGDSRPIGLFDSGIGGLTVVRALTHLLPNESIVYFGDTARVPYGTKSARTVREFALQDAEFLLGFDVKLIIVACHTASSVALDLLQRAYRIPVLGVIEPGVQAALRETKNRRIGVIGTRGTIESGSYPRLIKASNPDVQVFARPCPLFVPLVEEGWLDMDVTRQIAEIYLEPLKRQHIDTLILGCTHYPLLKGIIQEVMGPDVRLIDSAEETATMIAQLLDSQAQRRLSEVPPTRHFWVSDIPHRFKHIGESFLGFPLEPLSQVDLETLSSFGLETTEKRLAKKELEG